MIIKYFTFLIIFLLVGLSKIKAIEETPSLSRSEASSILQSGMNLREILYTLKLAAASTELRPIALSYLDGPSRRNQMINQLIDAHKDEAEIGTYALTEKYWGPYADYLKDIMTQSNQLDYFPVFTHFCESDLANRTGSADGYLRWYMANAKFNPRWESLLLDYFAHMNRDLYRVGYKNKDGQVNWTGVYDSRAGKFNAHWVTKEEEQKLAESGTEVREHFILDGALKFMLMIKSDLAVQKFIEAAAQPDCRETDIGFALPYDSYDPKFVPVYGMALFRMSEANKLWVINKFLNKSPGWSDGTMPKNIPSIDFADPSVYPGILAFIKESEKVASKMEDSNDKREINRIIATARTKAMDYYKKCNIPVPTDAELNKIVESWKQLAKPKSNPPPIAAFSSSTSSAPAQTRSLPDWLPYAVLGAVVLIGLGAWLRKRAT